MYNKLVLVVFTTIQAFFATAQLSVMPQIPNAGLIPKSLLWNSLLINNSSTPISVRMVVEVHDRFSNALVYRGRSGIFSIPVGPKYVGESAVNGVMEDFVGPAFERSGLITAGHYKVCQYFEETLVESIRLVEQCVAIDVEAMVPIQLIYPRDSSILLSSITNFSWLPPVPVNIFPDLRFDLIVALQYEGQSSTEAIERNTSIVNAFDLTSPMFNVADLGTRFDTGRHYVWQVVARNGYGYGAKSPIWHFKVENPSLVYPEIRTKYFLHLQEGKVDSYPFSNVIDFSFDNTMNDKEGNAQLMIVTAEGIQRIVAEKRLVIQERRPVFSWTLPSECKQYNQLKLSIQLKSGRRFEGLLMK